MILYPPYPAANDLSSPSPPATYNHGHNQAVNAGLNQPQSRHPRRLVVIILLFSALAVLLCLLFRPIEARFEGKPLSVWVKNQIKSGKSTYDESILTPA